MAGATTTRYTATLMHHHPCSRHQLLRTRRSPRSIILLVNLNPIHSQRKHNIHPRRHMHHILAMRMAPEAPLTHRHHQFAV